MISRIWHGWTKPANADAYENLLRVEILPSIAGKGISGYRGSHILRRDVVGGVEFVTILWFDSIESVKAFAGEEYGRAVVPPKARALLYRFDETSSHYTVASKPE